MENSKEIMIESRFKWETPCFVDEFDIGASFDRWLAKRYPDVTEWYIPGWDGPLIMFENRVFAASKVKTKEEWNSFVKKTISFEGEENLLTVCCPYDAQHIKRIIPIFHYPDYAAPGKYTYIKSHIITNVHPGKFFATEDPDKETLIELTTWLMENIFVFMNDIKNPKMLIRDIFMLSESKEKAWGILHP